MSQHCPTTPWRLRQAAHLLQQGGILAYPTESVFGLGCDPLNEPAVSRLLRIKQRDVSKGVILIADDFARLRPFIGDIDKHRLAEISRDWPGPFTWLLPAAPWVPAWLTGSHSTLAMRVTAHPIASALCRAADMPLVSTSANQSGRPPARTPLQVRIRCGNEIDWVLHGATSGLSQPTTIRDALSGATLR
ncbi:MAG: L-threonylcarbamoyladenylate synthase [Candidatus Thiodiazotropha sp.]|jgi:L-threonylcarbamoyladenylate synthase